MTCRAIAIRFGGVRLPVYAQACNSKGGVGWHAPQKIFGIFEAMRLILRQFLSQNDASQQPDDRVVYASQMRLARLIVCLEGRKDSEEILLHRSQPFRKIQHATMPCV